MMQTSIRFFAASKTASKKMTGYNAFGNQSLPQKGGCYYSLQSWHFWAPVSLPLFICLPCTFLELHMDLFFCAAFGFGELWFFGHTVINLLVNSPMLKYYGCVMFHSQAFRNTAAKYLCISMLSISNVMISSDKLWCWRGACSLKVLFLLDFWDRL